MINEIIAGRSCPLSYSYSPSVFNRAADVKADTIYIVGGLYGNPVALAKAIEMAALEDVAPPLIFNGDFNWFNASPESFEDVNNTVLRYHAIRGNVETELASDASGAGCGCAYPEDVSAQAVAWSNQIMEQLQHTAASFPDITARLAALPMHLVAEVGGVKIGIVHGDAHSLAGWSFSRSSLREADATLARDFIGANVQIFACTHTCLPATKRVVLDANREGLVINNGSAGMANFVGETSALITRISTTATAQKSRFNAKLQGLHIDLLEVDFAFAPWQELFLSQWPPGSPAYASYYHRILHGTKLTEVVNLK